MPRFCSSYTRLNSLQIGAGISSATTCIPAASECPARSARATSSIPSGSWAAKAASRLFRRQNSHMKGAIRPAPATTGATYQLTIHPLATNPRKAAASPIPTRALGLDVGVGLLDHLRQVQELGGQLVQDVLLVDLLQGLLQQHVGRRVLPGGPADQEVEPLGRPALVPALEQDHEQGGDHAGD
jgi:hypothetical protein